MTPAEITEARQALGMRRIDFARAFDVHPRTVRAWEDGEDAYRIPAPVVLLIRLALKYAGVKRELENAAAERKAADKKQPAPAG